MCEDFSFAFLQLNVELFCEHWRRSKSVALFATDVLSVHFAENADTKAFNFAPTRTSFVLVPSAYAPVVKLPFLQRSACVGNHNLFVRLHATAFPDACTTFGECGTVGSDLDFVSLLPLVVMSERVLPAKVWGSCFDAERRLKTFAAQVEDLCECAC